MSKTIMDVSRWQGNINWDKVKGQRQGGRCDAAGNGQQQDRRTQQAVSGPYLCPQLHGVHSVGHPGGRVWLL